MSILKDVFAELFSMFVADRWLTLSLLVLVAVCGGAHVLGLPGLAIGLLLLAGTLGVLWASVASAARRIKG